MWAIHENRRPPPIAGCPPVLEELMTSSWQKEAELRPTMVSIVEEMVAIQQYFPGANEPIFFPHNRGNYSMPFDKHTKNH